MTDAVTVHLRAGERGAPEFLSTGAPTLSWRVEGAPRDWRQVAAEIEVGRDGAVQQHLDPTDRSQRRPWPAAALSAHDAASVRVRLQDGGGVWTPWSALIPLRTGPLGPADWDAAFIAASVDPDDGRGATRLRHVVRVRAGLVSAILSLTSHGAHEAVVNGIPIDDVVLAPGWTAYERRLLFRSVDVTGLLREGPNVLGATVAEGWYRERFGFDGDFAVAYPGPVAFSAQLRLTYRDGSVEQVMTGDDWSASTVGPVVAASIYQGEAFDARLADDALADPAVELPGASAAVRVAADPARLEPLAAPPIRRIDRLPVREVLTTPSGATVLDFGQNLVGWLELRLDLPAGAELVLRHAEVLEDGELGVRPLRSAAATDRYIAAGGITTWSPRFTFHGFRYAEITGADVDPDEVVAVVVHSDMVRTGTLTTSDPLLDRLHENVVWGMRGNFVGIPTDCPQRDERLGWTGDIQVFARTASYLFDVSGFLGSWLRDLALEQGPDGAVPMVVPAPLPGPPAAAAAWGDAATLVPDALHERYGDQGVLRQQLDSMRAWVEAVRARAGDDLLWTGDFQFGDWLDPSAPPENPAAAKTDADLVATAYFFHSTSRLAAAAQVLGLQQEAAEHAALADRIGSAFRAAFVTPSGRVLSDAHTAYALVIVFGLVEGEQRRAAGERLAELVRAHGYRVRTGFVGTPLVCDALTATGHVETAYRLLLERGDPSWLHPVTMGATTVWERWDSMLPDGSINPGEMTSFNHYALGAVADWMQRVIGGIAPLEPGYRSVTVAPVPGGGLRDVGASLETGYGRIGTAWQLRGRLFSLQITVPVGVTATVRLPDGSAPEVVEHGTWSWSVELPDEPTRAAPLSMDSTLADLVDDPAARGAIESYFGRIGYVIGLGWTGSGRWRSDSVLGDSLLLLPPEGRDGLQQELDRLNRERAAAVS